MTASNEIFLAFSYTVISSCGCISCHYRVWFYVLFVWERSNVFWGGLDLVYISVLYMNSNFSQCQIIQRKQQIDELFFDAEEVEV